MKSKNYFAAVAVFFVSLVVAQAAQGQSEWTRQFGTAGTDGATGVAVSASGVYVVGHASGTLPGNVTGSGSGFLRKYDFSGNEVWTRQFDGVFVTSVAADSAGVYVAGVALITLPGQTGAGGADAFVRKYDADGNEVWTRQFGIVSFSSGDRANAVAVDATGVYVGGSAADLLGFLRKFDSNGNLLWARFPLTLTPLSHHNVRALAADGSSLFAAGVFSEQSFVRKYETNGNELWSRQFGTSFFESAFGVATDSSGVYVAGATQGTLAGTNAGYIDAFVRKYDHDGNEVWTRQFGTAGLDFAAGIAAHGSAVYVAGFIGVGTASDGFVRKYDADGNEVWVRALSTEEEDVAFGVAANEIGVFAAGHTFGVLPGQTSAGGRDAFVTRMTHLSAAQLIQQLVAQVVALNLRQGITNSFDAKLQTALNALEDANQNNNAAAVSLLQAFINSVEAQRGNELTSEQADALIATALEIISVLGG